MYNCKRLIHFFLRKRRLVLQDFGRARYRADFMVGLRLKSGLNNIYGSMRASSYTYIPGFTFCLFMHGCRSVYRRSLKQRKIHPSVQVIHRTAESKITARRIRRQIFLWSNLLTVSLLRLCVFPSMDNYCCWLN